VQLTRLIKVRFANAGQVEYGIVDFLFAHSLQNPFGIDLMRPQYVGGQHHLAFRSHKGNGSQQQCNADRFAHVRGHFPGCGVVSRHSGAL
jgi:hypothetical protein